MMNKNNIKNADTLVLTLEKVVMCLIILLSIIEAVVIGTLAGFLLSLIMAAISCVVTYIVVSWIRATFVVAYNSIKDDTDYKQ